MPTSYYNPNQQTTTPYKNYEGTKNYYAAKDSGRIRNPPRVGGPDTSGVENPDTPIYGSDGKPKGGSLGQPTQATADKTQSSPQGGLAGLAGKLTSGASAAESYNLADLAGKAMGAPRRPQMVSPDSPTAKAQFGDTSAEPARPSVPSGSLPGATAPLNWSATLAQRIAGYNPQAPKTLTSVPSGSLPGATTALPRGTPATAIEGYNPLAPKAVTGGVPSGSLPGTDGKLSWGDVAAQTIPGYNPLAPKMTTLAQPTGAPVGPDVGTGAGNADQNVDPNLIPQEGDVLKSEKQASPDPHPETYVEDLFKVRSGEMTEQEFAAAHNTDENWIESEVVRYTTGAPNIPGKGDLGINDITTPDAYKSSIDALLASLDTSYKGQEAHALSQNEAQKQSSLNDLAGLLGARGVGSSMAALMPGALDVEAQAAGQAGTIVGDIRKQQTDAKLQELATLGQIAESQGNLDLKAQVEQAANQIKEAQIGTDIESVELQQRQGVIDAWKQTEVDLKSMLGNPQINVDEQRALSAGWEQLSDAMNDPTVSARELQALYVQLISLMSSIQQDHGMGGTGN